MPDVPAVAARELRDPVALVVADEADDLALHPVTVASSSGPPVLHSER